MDRAETSRIVGRSEPCRRLDQAARAAAGGRRTAVLVSGEAGMGKTSLVRAALESLEDEEVVTGWGTCWHGEGAPGFWPWMQALDEIARTAGSEAAGAAAGPDRELLAVLVRELGPAGDGRHDPEQRRLLLLDAAVRWLEGLARHRQVVVVLDDLQWADSSTLDLLEQVVATPLSARLLVVGAYRDDELGGERATRLATLGSHGEHIHLHGLQVAEVEELIASVCGDVRARELAPELHRRTGGHPLFVRELARLPDVGNDGLLPTAVTGALTRRLDGLPESTRRLLDAACVLGNRLLPDVLGGVIEERPAGVVQLLEGAVAAGVVRTGADEQLWFAHDLYRETLYAGLSLTERARLHARVGEELEGRRARGAAVSPGDLARHFTRGVASGDPARAVHWAREAARDEHRRGAFSEAAAHLRRARTAVNDVGWAIDPDLLVRMLVEEADAWARSGDPDVARRLLLEASTAAPGPEQVADVALAVQRLSAKFAAPRDEIIAQLEKALAGIAGRDPIRQARLTAALARELQHSVSQDRRRAGALSEEALVLGRSSGDDATLAACLLARHDALWSAGTGVPRSALGREIAEVGARLGDTDRVAEGLLLEANGLLEAGSPGFRPVLDRWFGILDARDEPRDRYLTRTRRAALALLEGDADRAESLMYDAAAVGERIHEPDTRNVLMSQRVALARVRRDPDELTALAGDAVEWWTGAPVLAHAVAAGALAGAGKLEAAGREVAMVAAAGGWHGEDSYLRSVLVAELAEAATALHDGELCARLLEDIAPLTESCGVNGAVVAFAGPFAHAAGILAAELGDRDRATSLLRASVATARRLGAAVWLHHSEAALSSLADARAVGPGQRAASLRRTGGVWAVTFGEETGSLSHVKGLSDIATLVRHPGREVTALELMGGARAGFGDTEQLVDLQALRAYRQRLDELTEEIDRAEDDADLATIDRLRGERDQLLAELRRATGLGGRIRTVATEPAERARKAVSGRVRDALRRLDAVAPSLAAHLDRSIRTGLRCSYEPVAGEAAVRWLVED